VSYPVFIERALHHLGLSELARDCEGLKNVTTQALQASMLDELLADMMISSD